MAISKNKKRYQVTLTPSIVDRFQGLVDEIGLPPSTMSMAIDDFLKDMSEVFQTAKDSGTMRISDIFKVMGKQVELVIEEERRAKNVPEPKRDKIPNKKRSARTA